VDLPSGADPPKHPKNVEGKKPRLYLLNVRALALVCGLAFASASCRLQFCHSLWPCPCVSQLRCITHELVADVLSPAYRQDVSGAFRPNVLTALIGETGAGKTTLMVRSHALSVQADPSSSVSQTLKDGVNVQW
jgi:hypothetical protein